MDSKMKNNNVVYLIDHIKDQEMITTLDDHHQFLNLAEPSGHIMRRVIALGIDFMTIGLIKSSLHGAYAIFVTDFLAPLNGHKQMSLIEGNLNVHILSFILVYWCYFFYTTYIMSGKTLGKMAMGLRIINEDFVKQPQVMHYEPSIEAAIKRSLGYVMCYLSFGTFFVLNFSSEDKRGLPDYVSNTRTVSDLWLAQMLEHKEFNQEHIVIDIKELAVEEKQAA